MEGENTTVADETGSKFNALSILTAIQRLPTPFISAFMLVHLSAPLIASIGGSSASSQVMVSTCPSEYRFCVPKKKVESDVINREASGPGILSRAIYRTFARICTSWDTCCLLPCAAYPSQYQAIPLNNLSELEIHSRKNLAQTQVYAPCNTLGIPGSRLLCHSRRVSQTSPFPSSAAHLRAITFRTGLRVCQVRLADVPAVGVGYLWRFGLCGAIPCQ